MVRSPILARSELDRISCAAPSIVLKPHVQYVENSSLNIELDPSPILLPIRSTLSFLFAYRCGQQLKSDTLRNIN